MLRNIIIRRVTVCFGVSFLIVFVLWIQTSKLKCTDVSVILARQAEALIPLSAAAVFHPGKITCGFGWNEENVQIQSYCCVCIPLKESGCYILRKRTKAANRGASTVLMTLRFQRDELSVTHLRCSVTKLCLNVSSEGHRIAFEVQLKNKPNHHTFPNSSLFFFFS